MRILKRSFYSRDPDKVAKNLLGKILVRKIGDKILSGKIVETEAYFGREDPASRAHLGRPRYCVELLHDTPGKSLVYMVHGNWLFNVVAHAKGRAGAVLIRAIEPLSGIDIMLKNREVNKITNLTNGPGKLTKALNITMKQNGIDLTSSKSEIFIRDSREKFEVCTSKRIGVTRDLKIDLRFYIKGNRFVAR